MVYLYIYTWLFVLVDVGKYTSPMDAMGECSLNYLGKCDIHSGNQTWPAFSSDVGPSR